MLYLKSDLPIAGREDVWGSEVHIKEITPARRDKLVNLLNLAGFVLTDDIKAIGEIGEVDGTYVIKVA